MFPSSPLLIPHPIASALQDTAPSTVTAADISAGQRGALANAEWFSLPHAHSPCESVDRGSKFSPQSMQLLNQAMQLPLPSCTSVRPSSFPWVFFSLHLSSPDFSLSLLLTLPPLLPAPGHSTCDAKPGPEGSFWENLVSFTLLWPVLQAGAAQAQCSGRGRSSRGCLNAAPAGHLFPSDPPGQGQPQGNSCNAGKGGPEMGSLKVRLNEEPRMFPLPPRR